MNAALHEPLATYISWPWNKQQRKRRLAQCNHPQQLGAVAPSYGTCCHSQVHADGSAGSLQSARTKAVTMQLAAAALLGLRYIVQTTADMSCFKWVLGRQHGIGNSPARACHAARQDKRGKVGQGVTQRFSMQSSSASGMQPLALGRVTKPHTTNAWQHRNSCN